MFVGDPANCGLGDNNISGIKIVFSESLFLTLKFTYFSIGYNSATYWILFADTWDAPIGCADFNQAIVDNKMLGLRNSQTFPYKINTNV